MRLVLCLNYKRIEVIMELTYCSDDKDDGYHLPRATTDLVCQVFYIHVIFTKAMQSEYYSSVFPIDKILCYVMRNMRLK